MQKNALNCATCEVANNRDISGRATAGQVNRPSRIRKRNSFGRIIGLTVLGFLTTAGFMVALGPMAARAGEDEGGVYKQIEALEAKVSALQATVSILQGQVSSLQVQLAVVQSNPALALGPFVTVDPDPEIGVVGPNITFKGANIHIVSGTGFTDDNDHPIGLGNLIIGYDEPPGSLSSTDRSGSHNLVIGRYNKFTQAAFGGLVAGELNTISNRETSVTGGANNIASGLLASVSGGVSNTASGGQASVSGGDGNTASGTQSSVSGGAGNTANGSATAVIGGQNVTDNVDGSIRPQPPFTP